MNPVLAIMIAANPVADRDLALVAAIEQVESGGYLQEVGDEGRAVGVLQIHKIVVDDCNRIIKQKALHYDDRWSQPMSREIFWIITYHYSSGASREVIARRWNGGPTGEQKEATLDYWHKVEAALREQEQESE